MQHKRLGSLLAEPYMMPEKLCLLFSRGFGIGVKAGLSYGYHSAVAGESIKHRDMLGVGPMGVPRMYPYRIENPLGGSESIGETYGINAHGRAWPWRMGVGVEHHGTGS